MEKKTVNMLMKIVDYILWNEWDPIGVNKLGGTDDEYTSYVPQIITARINNKSVEDITNILNEITARRMGLDSNLVLCNKIAERIYNLPLDPENIKLLNNKLFKNQ